MVSEVISAPPELRVPVTVCSVMSSPLPTEGASCCPFYFLRSTPPHLAPQLVRLRGGSPGSVHPEFGPHHMLHVCLTGQARGSVSASAEWGAAQGAREGLGYHVYELV